MIMLPQPYFRSRRHFANVVLRMLCPRKQFLYAGVSLKGVDVYEIGSSIPDGNHGISVTLEGTHTSFVVDSRTK